LSTLGRVDYEDAFAVEVETPGIRSAEQWFRMILEDASIGMRLRLLWGWSMIGLKVGFPGSSDSVLGWKIRAGGADYVLLGAESRIGMPGELLLRREEHGLMFATFVRQDNSAARALWAAVEPGHVRTVLAILEDAAQRARR
jgi:hypothetical protein